ncbi:hypothetical protein [Bradyrhizobium sp. AUGA SZCCT0283]|uniref:hypothetical protein n=1 Tax=Bradyrhizobium sp. AUGA SZCCT0283 TaxID=2807671 RepID=UPI0028A0FB4F|nr:hypothetical protein [Bradyrhizobium sp. AUGA SZCCT0283]
MQRHVATAGDGGQRSVVPRLVGSRLLDSNEADFAAVVETKGASIDHGGDTAFALRLQRAIDGIGPSDGGQHEK